MTTLFLTIIGISLGVLMIVVAMFYNPKPRKQ